MWGSSFADLAKKAHELQEQAAQASSGLSTAGLFDLDAMQSKPAKKKTEKQQPASTTAAAASQPQPAVQSSFQLPSFGQSTVPPASPTVIKAPMKKGKLKINLSPNQQLKGKAALKTGLVTKLSTSEEKPANESVASSSKDENKAALVVEDKQDLVEPATKPEAESAENTSQNGAKSEMLPPMDKTDNANDKSATAEPLKSAAPVSLENNQQESEKISQMTNDQGAVSSNGSKDEVAFQKPTEEPDNPMTTVAEPGTDTAEKLKVEEQEKKMEMKEDADQGNEKTKADIGGQRESNPAIEANDEEAGQKLEPSPQVEERVDDQPDQAPDPGEQTVETDEAKSESQEAPLPEDMAPSTTEGETRTPNEGERESINTKTATTPAQPEDKISNKQMQAAAQPGDNQQKPPPQAGATPPVLPANAGADAERVMQQFTAQLQRIEANFDAERKQMRQDHQNNVQNAIASKAQEMEHLRAKMKEKDLKLRELKRIKEGNELRMDSLKREVEGIKELLEQRDAEIEELKKMRDQDRKQLEKQVRAVEAEHAKTQKELKGMKDELKNSKGALGATNDEYSTLKSRVKVVAGELKERRAECRDLKNKIEEQDQSKEKLEDHVSNLESQLSDRDRSGNEKDEAVGGLRSKIEQLETKLKETDTATRTKEGEFEMNLGSYKKKAQNSLAVANSRAAAAVQAKEEAELEARAARSTADSTMERARVAEEKGRKAMEDAKEYYREMEEAKARAVDDLKVSEVELQKAKQATTELQEKLELSASENGNLASEKAQMSRDVETERTESSNLQRELTGAQRRLGVLEGDVTGLRGQLQIAKAAAIDAMETQKSNHANPTPAEDSTIKATVRMLQSQLNEANETIEELREALQNAIAMSEKSEGTRAERDSDQGVSNKSAATNGNDGSVPLFYAMEKQAELNTARNEINRLSSLYADVQSEKAEAQEAQDATQKELDGERARLQRYEKLGSASNSGAETSSSNANGAANREEASGGNANIEYLKNIMLSFLNAKTLAEKKALVPVIGAVLCLTPDEQTRAIQNVESTGGIEGFSSAFFETIGSRVGRG